MNQKRFNLIGISLAAGLLTLLPPWVIGRDSSALTLQSLEHWIGMNGHPGPPDMFEALHIQWLWMPRLIALLTGSAFSALVVFRVIVVWAALFLFMLAARRLTGERRAIIGGVMLALNVTLLFLFHTFGSQLLTLLAACALLYLFTSPHARDHRLGALLFGLSLAIGFWSFLLLIAILTVGLNLHHSRYTLRSRETYLLFGMIVLGAASYLMLEIFYFGTAQVWQAIVPHFFAPRGVSRILEGIIIAAFSINVLFASAFRPKPGGIAREFQAAFLLLGVFFLANAFSREAMLDDVVVILPCLILVALDTIKKIGRFCILYGIVNLGLFFILPASLASPELALVNARRDISQDVIALSYYKTFDLFRYSQLLEIHSGEEAAKSLLSKQRLDSTLVLLNASTDTWLDASTLGAEFPAANFGWYYGRPLNIVRWNGLKDSIFLGHNPAVPYLSGFFEASFAHNHIDTTLPGGTPLSNSAHFQYIDSRGNEAAKKALTDQLFFLQYQGFHQR